MVLKITKKQARLFLLEKQLLNEEKKLGEEGIRYVFEQLRVIQYDPLNPCGKNADLVLQSRVSGYHPDDYYHWIYEERHGIECYDKELCIIPIEDFSLTSHSRTNASAEAQIRSFLKKYQKQVSELLEFIRVKGPVTTLDVEHQEKISGFDWYGSRFGRVALEILWRTGRVVIAKRIQGKKYYDLPHTVYSGDHFGSDTIVERNHILRRMKSVGILPLSGSGGGWQGLGKARTVHTIIQSLLEDGTLQEVEVRDIKAHYVILMEDRERIQNVTLKRNDVMFIAPLDTLMWDRKMIYNFFDFAYTWEVYVPLPRRKFGYYVIPVLYQGQIIGRIEPLLDKEKNLIIKGFWKEETVVWTKEMTSGLNEAIKTFKEYLNAKKVIRLDKKSISGAVSVVL